MKKVFLAMLLASGLAVSVLSSTVAYADGQKVVTLGADLTEEQRTAILKYFGVYGQSLETLYITNQDERDHLGSYIPLEQIGSRTFSCALVNPTTSGGIRVKTANLSYVTSNMIATTLSTSGVVNCEVLAASPFEVSGTGALTGIIMAYEAASGYTLDTQKKDIATQELITTGTIANQLGQAQATNIVNEIKIQVIENQVIDEEEVIEIVNEVIDEELDVETGLTDEDRQLLIDLAERIAEQQYNFEDMEATLLRVEENVSALNESVAQVADAVDEISVDEPSSAEEPLAADSILLNTDDQALGENVIMDATDEQALPTPEVAPEPKAEEEFVIYNESSYNEEPVQPTPEPQPEAAPQAEPEPQPEAAPQAEPEPQLEAAPVYEEPVQIEQPQPEANEEGENEFGFEIVSGDTYEDDWSEPEPQPDEVPQAEPAPQEEVENPEAYEEYGEEEEPQDDFYGEEAGDEGDSYEDEGGDSEEEDVPEVAAPALELADSEVKISLADADETNGAGASILKLQVAASDIIPISGSVSVTNYNDVNEQIDLADNADIVTAPMSDEEVFANGWAEGTDIYILLSEAFRADSSYDVSLQGTFAQAESADNAADAPQADVNKTGSFYTGRFGGGLQPDYLDDLSANNYVTAALIYPEGEAAYAQITVDDPSIAYTDIDTLDLVNEGDDFQINLISAGSTKVRVSFLDADYNEVSGVVIPLIVF